MKKALGGMMLLIFFLFPEKGLFKKNQKFQINSFNNLVDKPILYQNGLLFTYLSKKSDKVYLSGSFNNWQERIPFQRNDLGISYVFLRKNLKKGIHQYRFNVNGYWLNDPEQSLFSLDENGNKISSFKIDKSFYFIITNPIKIKENIYRFYLEDKGYQQVFWLGKENQWNKFSDPMVKKDNYWIIDKKFFQKKNLYIFSVDGKFLLDPINTKMTKNNFDLKVNYFN